ncbi:MAG: metal ABC transporter substrate-binding protein [Armatimonadota bacterium]|nr:metal ABC transporter substrate-binding protein [Armatimonadota bacterium]MDW8103717.1 metal ABC transporter substrate-binding protein [Armatimonadota bacterium]
MTKRTVLTLLWVLVSLPAVAQVRVVTTFTDLADLVKQVGGNRVQVSALARPQDDFHLVTPRPSMALELSRARLFVRVGMDLDLWADDLLTAARNASILRGASGYVDCSVGVKKLEVPTGRVDPSMGDIHLYGNPHYLFDPVNAKVAARNILEGLKRVDPAHATEYQQNYEAFAQRVEEHLKRWQQALAPYRGAPVVVYHKSLTYFLQRFGLQELATVEPKPGIPPSPGHLREVVQRMKSAGCRVILVEHFRPRRFAEAVARETGAKVVVLPVAVGAEGTSSYLQMVDTMVSRVAAALAGR